MPEKTSSAGCRIVTPLSPPTTGPIFSTVAKLVEALRRALPHSHDLELKREALRLGCELLRGTKYDEER